MRFIRQDVVCVRRRLTQLLHRHWFSHGFVVMSYDGSRLECPRSAELEKRLGYCRKLASAPMLCVTRSSSCSYGVALTPGVTLDQILVSASNLCA
jgi:hypothetical protein